MSFFKKFTKGVKGAFEAMATDECEVEGKQITCCNCGSKHFETGKAQLNTSGMSFLDLDWLNKSAPLLICKRCSFIMWFAKDVEKSL